MAEPRAVIITGASTGIGAACARYLDQLGFRVFAGVRKAADGEALAAGARSGLTPIQLDVTKAEEIAAARAAVEAEVGAAGLAGLVNNAGIGAGGPLEFVPLDGLRYAFEVNVFGAIAMVQAMLPLLRAGRGRIVNMSSIGGRIAYPFMGPYNSSKWALEALSDSLRRELRPWGIHVAVIEPGNIQTPIWGKARTLADNVDPRAQALYGPGLEFAMNVVNRAEGTGLPPEVVARAVAHALVARRPRTRYVIGRDARLVNVLRFLPDTLLDRLMARVLPRYGPDVLAAGERPALKE